MPPPAVSVDRPVFTPRQAVFAAADAAPAGVAGVFTMRVARTGRAGGRVYLNSESDYRDQRNLTINIDPVAAAQVFRRFRSDAGRFFRHKLVSVTGVARRVRIDFLDNRHRRTGRYYYQTHVMVTDVSQISVTEEPGARR